MRTITSRRAARATAVLLLAIASVASIGRIAFSEDAPLTDRRPIPETPAIEQRTTQTSPPSVGVSTSPSSRCGQDRTWFDNPVMHVGFCVPNGWGFTDFTTPHPMQAVPREQLTNLHLLSARAFPWTPGTRPFDAIRARGIIDVEMTLLETGMVATTECEPSLPRPHATLRLLTCEQRYDTLGLPAPAGDLRAIKILVPLATTPDPVHDAPGLAGARLLVIARTSEATTTQEVEQLWQLVDSIAAF